MPLKSRDFPDHDYLEVGSPDNVTSTISAWNGCRCNRETCFAKWFLDIRTIVGLRCKKYQHIRSRHIYVTYIDLSHGNDDFLEFNESICCNGLSKYINFWLNKYDSLVLLFGPNNLLFERRKDFYLISLLSWKRTYNSVNLKKLVFLLLHFL